MKYLAIGLAVLALVNVARADLVGHHEGASELLLSGDGKVAFSSDAKQTRVWDVEARRELAALPREVGRLVASSSDGHRVLCVESFTSQFWRLNAGKWQKGTLIPQHEFAWPLLDAHFSQGKARLMWPGLLEQFAPNGLMRERRKFDESSARLSEAGRSSTPVGTLSADGKRLLLWAGGWARVCDAKSGRRLTPIQEPKDWATRYDRRYDFAPDNSLVLERMQYYGINASYFPEDGPPLLFDLAVYDAKNGTLLHLFEKVGPFNCPVFRPADGKLSVLLQAKSENSKWALERRDVRNGAILPLDFFKPGPPERWLSHLYFSDDEKRIVALDEKGDLWQEKLQ